MAPEPFHSYDDALDYLYGFINWEVERHMRYTPEVMTLDRPRALLKALGSPQDRYPIIHITGTKGKGSVGAMCAAALQASGLRAALYSSPHLQDFRERFRVDNALITPDEFVAMINRMRPIMDTMPDDITWFEVTTALAFLYFAEREVDVAVIEVGLGGRLDATNVVTPIVSVITSLSYDHTHLLGDSLASIAREKAGIIKPGVPVVSAPQPEEALQVLAEAAAARRAPLTLIGRDWQYTPGETTRAGQVFTAAPVGAPPQPYWTGLTGEHQALNATVALAALDRAAQAGVGVTEQGIREGLRRVDWPGRVELVAQNPAVVLDAAHNGASARWLNTTLDALFPQRPRVLIFGVSADKDIRGMFEALLPGVDHLIAAQAVHPRALAAEEIEAVARAVGFTGSIDQIPHVGEALAQAQRLAGSDGLVVTTGSLFIVGEVRTIFGLPPGHAARISPVMTDARPPVSD
ncbi:MAG: bifunctional folylpolyglutamate synthase/dihydrofolate synthase [Anaerolineae bacterium]|nr:bifunctional folylpolyglutamate synthase/dihydrofolate synthase [Anaerolineae bacterium]